MREKLRFLGLDVHAETIAVAIAEPEGEVRSLGTIANREDSKAGSDTAGAWGHVDLKGSIVPLKGVDGVAGRAKWSSRPLPNRSQESSPDHESSRRCWRAD